MCVRVHTHLPPCCPGPLSIDSAFEALLFMCSFSFPSLLSPFRHEAPSAAPMICFLPDSNEHLSRFNQNDEHFYKNMCTYSSDDGAHSTEYERVLQRYKWPGNKKWRQTFLLALALPRPLYKDSIRRLQRLRTSLGNVTPAGVSTVRHGILGPANQPCAPTRPSHAVRANQRRQAVTIKLKSQWAPEFQTARQKATIKRFFLRHARPGFTAREREGFGRRREESGGCS